MWANKVTINRKTKGNQSKNSEWIPCRKSVCIELIQSKNKLIWVIEKIESIRESCLILFVYLTYLVLYEMSLKIFIICYKK